MAKPLPAAKRTVDLSAPARRMSRIRRDPPPPPERKLTRAELREREKWVIGIGVTAFALALFLIILAVNNGPGWTPGQLHVVVEGS